MKLDREQVLICLASYGILCLAGKLLEGIIKLSYWFRRKRPDATSDKGVVS